ncbi:hypothetical protein IWX63_001468 [Arthrobacter sp. CAN_A2]
MSATRCTCVWTARPLVRLVDDPMCPAYTLHVLKASAGGSRDHTTEP